MQSIATLGIEVKSNGVDEATRKLRGLETQGSATERKASDVARSWQAAGKAIGVAIGAGIGIATTAFAVYVRNTIEAEKVQAQLAARIKSTGGAAGLAMADLNKMADALQAATTFDDESIGKAQATLLTFTKIGRENFGAATEAVLNLSTALGTDLNGAALQVGKALNDPVQGVTALSRAGVQFSDAQKAVIKSLVETGKTAKAQELILHELETQMGGAARAARDTLGGALQGLKNTLDNLLEGDSGSGGLRGAREAVEQLNATLNDPAIKAGIDTTANGLIRLASLAIQAAAAIGGLAQAMRDALSEDSRKSYMGLLAQKGRLEEELARSGGQGIADANDPIGKLLGLRDGGDAAKLKKRIAEVDRLLAQAQSAMQHPGGPLVDHHSGTGIFANVNTTPTASGGGGSGGGSGAGAAAKAQRDYASAARDAAAALREQQAAEDALLAKSLADENARSDAIAQFAHLSAQLSGPLKVAELDHIDRMEQIRKLGEAAGVGAAAITAAQMQETAAYQQTTAAIKEQMDALANPATVQVMDDFRRGFADTITDIATGARSASDAIKDLFNSLAAEITHMIAQRWADQLFGSMGATGKGTGGGGWLSGLLGALFSSGGGGGFASGGYTGNGPRNEIAGVVHRGEYVIPANVVDVLRSTPRTAAAQPRSGPPVLNQTIVVQGVMRDNTPGQIAQASSREQRRWSGRNG